MSNPDLGLQGAIVEQLKADAAVSAIVEGRIFDRVPGKQGSDGSFVRTAEYPYVSLGADQEIPDFADCYDGTDIVATLHAWSQKPGFPQVKRLARAIKEALHGAPLTWAGDRLVDMRFEGAVYLRDPDGLTSHAVITFRALTEPAD